MFIPHHKKNIMVHCLDTPKTWAEGKTAEDVYDAVYNWHVLERGWRAIAYALIIMPDGQTIGGRDLDNDGDVWEETGAGARGWNKNTIHIALVGGKGGTANDDPLEHYTQAQMDALRMVIDQIQKTAGRKLRVMGHNEVAAKSCPNFQVVPWYKEKKPRSILQSKTIQGAALSAVGSASVWSSIRDTVINLSPTAQVVLVGGAVAICLGLLVVVYSRGVDFFVKQRR